MSDDRELELRRIAERRADMKIAFRSHLIAYVVVNAGLVVINLMTTPGEYWFQWPMFGWGLGLLAHGIVTYGDVGYAREQMIEAELKRLRGRS